MTNAELIKELRYCGQEQDVIDCADITVSHWMPLPDAPEVEGCASD